MNDKKKNLLTNLSKGEAERLQSEGKITILTEPIKANDKDKKCCDFKLDEGGNRYHETNCPAYGEKKEWEESKTSWNKGLTADIDERVRSQGLSQRREKVTYDAYHRRLITDRGRPSKCEHCGTSTAKRFEWANLTGNYADPNDYIRLCTKCHHKMDGLNRNLAQVGGRYKKRLCKKCGKEFEPLSSRVVFCGSRMQKVGCAYEEYLAYGRSYHRNKKSDLLNEQ